VRRSWACCVELVHLSKSGRASRVPQTLAQCASAHEPHIFLPGGLHGPGFGFFGERAGTKDEWEETRHYHRTLASRWTRPEWWESSSNALHGEVAFGRALTSSKSTAWKPVTSPDSWCTPLCTELQLQRERSEASVLTFRFTIEKFRSVREQWCFFGRAQSTSLCCWWSVLCAGWVGD
jgi:hypothetical protein